MPSLSIVRAANASQISTVLGARPVCIVVGGTSGIGQGIAEAVARHTSGDAHIILVGRNHTAAEEVIARFPLHAEATHEFVECDLSLVANVKRVAASLQSRLPRVDLLVFTSGAVSLQSTVTSEGIERSMAIWYYSRWAFIDALLPLLGGARVLSMLNAVLGKTLDADDIDLKKALGRVKTLGDLQEVGQIVGTYQDYMVKAFAARNPTISFVHSAPGPVDTPLFSVSPSAELRAMAEAVKTATAAVSKTIEECGESQLPRNTASLLHPYTDSSAMTPPNDAWDIPDIVEVILDTVAAPLETKEPAVAATAYGDLATLARTCRKFNEPAMARLWRTQTTLYNLLHDLPPHCWTISGQWDSRTGQYTDWRILHEEAAHSSDAWTTVRARAARIRCLRLHGRFHISLFDTLFAADQPLFVNLQETSVPIDLQSFPELFFPPTLRALRLCDSRRAVYNSMRRGLDEGDAEVTAATLRHLATLPELRNRASRGS
ncbi:hypothetical protein MKEN_00187500 [Mycena kentingensis (nom. inval.)]|nr:hypothetical protein MKEN_00187500 [Mycena kentingensis (nom. inval.)]